MAQFVCFFWPRKGQTWQPCRAVACIIVCCAAALMRCIYMHTLARHVPPLPPLCCTLNIHICTFLYICIHFYIYVYTYIDVNPTRTHNICLGRPTIVSRFRGGKKYVYSQQYTDAQARREHVGYLRDRNVCVLKFRQLH